MNTIRISTFILYFLKLYFNLIKMQKKPAFIKVLSMVL